MAWSAFSLAAIYITIREAMLFLTDYLLKKKEKAERYYRESSSLVRHWIDQCLLILEISFFHLWRHNLHAARMPIREC